MDRRTSSTASEHYSCLFPGCGKTYLRNEHLSRHAKSHIGYVQHVCPGCGKRFSRQDVARRHISRQHPQIDARLLLRSKVRQACELCQARKTRCDGNRPCQSCKLLDHSCQYNRDYDSKASKISPTPMKDDVGLVSPSLVSASSSASGEASFTILPMPSVHQPQLHLPSPLLLDKELVKTYISYYFVFVHPSWPIIHRPSFDEASEDESLLQTMAMMGAWESSNLQLQQLSLMVQPKLLESICQRI
ncbi:hypothetical protein CC79DRAFT_1397497, partial [Sarocladium strictum]